MEEMGKQIPEGRTEQEAEVAAAMEPDNQKQPEKADRQAEIAARQAELAAAVERDFEKQWISAYGEDGDGLVIRNAGLMLWLRETGFFTAPASTKYHGAYDGGLYDHSRMVFRRLRELTERNGLVWQRRESPFIVGFFHDLCKIDQYRKVSGDAPAEDGQKRMIPGPGYHYEFNANTLLKGHGSKSAMLAGRFIDLTEEELLCIRYHMGPYEREEWNEFDRAIKKYETVLWTHTADMLASKVDRI